MTAAFLLGAAFGFVLFVEDEGPIGVSFLAVMFGSLTSFGFALGKAVYLWVAT